MHGTLSLRIKIAQNRIYSVDSEHFSIWKLLKNNKKNNISKVYITASGGPFLNLPKKILVK